MTELGITATRRGLTDPQRVAAFDLLVLRRELGAARLHHGACVGGDEQVAELAHELGYFLIAHPSDMPGLTSDYALTLSHEVRPSRPPLDRNRDIVDETDHALLAHPAGQVEVTRSGTWATVRYARRTPDLPRVMVWPDGTVSLDGQ